MFLKKKATTTLMHWQQARYSETLKIRPTDPEGQRSLHPLQYSLQPLPDPTPPASALALLLAPAACP
jgi:hypothetical protein